MSAVRLNRILNQKVLPLALYGAIVSLVTSWVLETPDLNHKAATLQAVQEKTLPSLAIQVAAAQTKLRQSECDRSQLEQVLFDAVVTDQTVDWDDLLAKCQKVRPVKPVPVEKMIQAVEPKS